MQEIHYPKPRQHTLRTHSLLKDLQLQAILNHREQILVINILDLVENESTGWSFSTKLEELIKWRPKTEVARLLKWLKTVIDYHSYESRNYSKIAYSILWAFEQRRFITSQTQAQFEISIDYLKLVLQSNIRMESASRSNSLLLIILLLGIRPDLQVRSFKNHFEKYLWFDQDNGFFKHLFVKRPSLDFLVPHLEDLDTGHLNALILLLTGAKLSEILPEHLNVTKSENRILHQYSFKLHSAKDHFFERYILTAKLINLAPNTMELIVIMIQISKIFKDRLATFSDDIEFWVSVTQFIVHNRKEFSQRTSLRELIDYFEFMRYYDDEPFTYSLKGRTISSVTNAMKHWHHDLSYSNVAELETSWDGSKIEPWLYLEDGDAYIIEEILEGRRLFKESKTLHHCAFSYLYSCINGSLSLFSLSKVDDQNKLPFYTIEVRNGRIEQIGGACNAAPTKEINQIIKSWCTERNLIF